MSMRDHRITHIKSGIHWVGVVDWDLRDFHGFSTSKGGSYNAFLVDGEEPALIDTVKTPFTDEFIQKISMMIDLKRIKHFIVNHIEPDHSGAFTEVLRNSPNAQVYASEIAKAGLHRYYDFQRDIQIVRSGEKLNLGGRIYQFIETPMAHWPDSMVTYMPNDRVLFSSDIFGQLIATSERFDHEITPPFDDAALYYANIILPFNRTVLQTLTALETLKIRPQVVLPDHGIFWKKHIGDIVARYRSWADGSCAQGVLILYDSMWGSTEIMANRIYSALVQKGVKVRKLHIRSNPLSRIVTEIMFSRAVLIGTPTINDTIFPSVGKVLIYLQGLRPGPGRIWAAFGSYGWGGGGVEYVMRWLHENQYSVIQPPLESRFRPKQDILAACDRYAEEVSKALRRRRQ